MDFCHKVMMLPFNTLSRFVMGFPSGSDGKESAYRCKKTQVRSLGWEDPWRREWQLTPVFLPGESHGQRSLAGYSPWSSTESDTTEQLTLRFVIAFHPRNKHFLISWLQSPPVMILKQKKIKSVTVSIVFPSVYHEVI